MFDTDLFEDVWKYSPKTTWFVIYRLGNRTLSQAYADLRVKHDGNGNVSKRS